MKRLSETFACLRQQRRKALIPFLTAGYPSHDAFITATKTIAANGADIIEIGFPHSDPLADGPVIQKSSQRAIEQGFTVERGFNMLRNLSVKIKQPLVLMCYYNLILATGICGFFRKCQSAGVSGLIVPDLIIEEGVAIRETAQKYGMAIVNLITPTTDLKRVVEITRRTTGFVYLVSVTGTTGVRSRITTNFTAIIRQIRNTSDIPICLGFGISSPEMAQRLSHDVDGVIIGSALLKLLQCNQVDAGLSNLAKFIRQSKKKLGGNGC